MQEEEQEATMSLCVTSNKESAPLSSKTKNTRKINSNSSYLFLLSWHLLSCDQSRLFYLRWEETRKKKTGNQLKNHEIDKRAVALNMRCLGRVCVCVWYRIRRGDRIRRSRAASKETTTMTTAVLLLLFVCVKRKSTGSWGSWSVKVNIQPLSITTVPDASFLALRRVRLSLPTPQAKP